MSLKTKRFYDFADFRLDPAEKILLRDGQSVPLTPKVFETLQILIENSGRLLEKDELMQRLWQDRFVEESNLTFNIKMLRKALGDRTQQPSFIETVPRRGYRFIAEVREISAESTPEKTDRHTASKKNFSMPDIRAFYLPAGAVALSLISIMFFVGRIERASKSPGDATLILAPFALEKLSTNGKVFHTVISPNGKNLIYTNIIGGKESVWLRELESGSNFEIISPSDAVYYGLEISPDGGTLYFASRLKNVERQADIYRVSVFGGVPVKVAGEAQGWMSVSPDGLKISFVRCFYREDENCSLWIADSADGKNEKKLLARPQPFRIAANRFSPAGTSIAFASGQSKNAANEFGLSEIDIETGEERPLTPEKFFNNKSLAWLPDGKDLLVTASRIPNKNFGIWRISINSGSAGLLTRDAETYSNLSLDKSASLLISTQIKQDFHLRLFETENPSANRILTDATNVAFAPDGKIIFSSAISGNDEIWSIETDGSRQKQLTNDLADDKQPVVSPDDGSIFFASNRTGKIEVWKMNADGTDQTQITETDGGFPYLVTPDGKWVYYLHGVSRKPWRVSTGGGDEKQISNESITVFAVSPDGSRSAFIKSPNGAQEIFINSLFDGHFKKTFKFTDSSVRITSLFWMPDGTAVAYISIDGKSKEKTLWVQPLNGKEALKIAALGAEDIVESAGIAIAPDGKFFAVAQGGWKHDAVLLKGLR